MVRRVPDRMSSLLPYWTSSLTDLFSPRAQHPLNGSYVPFGRYLYFLLSGRISTSIVQPSHAANGRLFGASLIEPGLRSFFTTYSPPAVEHTTGRVEPSPRFVLVIQVDAQVEADRDEHAALLQLAERAHLVGLGAGEFDRFGPEPGDVLLHLADGHPHDVAAESLLHRGARVWAERSLLHRTFRRDPLGQLQIDQRAGVDSPQRREHSDLTAILRPLGLLRRRGRRRSDLPCHGLACHGGTTTRSEQTQSDVSNERPQHESPRPFQSR